MPTNTTNYSFKKPVVGADEDLWGGYINDNLDDLDSLLGDGAPLHIDTTNDRVGVGTSTPSTGKLVVQGGSNYVLTNSGQARDSGIHVDGGASGGVGSYGGAISFGTNNGAAAISSVQGTADDDVQGLAFHVHTSGTGSADAVEAMRIAYDGDVGIGTSSPQAKLHVSNGSAGFEFAPDGISNGTSYMQAYDRVAGTYDNVRWYAGEHYFHIGNDEKMRIDASGNLLVGKTADNFGVAGHQLWNIGIAYHTRDSGHSIALNRLNSDGDIAKFYKDGSTVGAIGANGARLVMTSDNGSAGSGIYIGVNVLLPTNRAGTLVDNKNDLGQYNYRWDDVYATNGTIQTSDEREKQDIAELDEAERRVAVAAKGLLRKFRWKDAVAEKGDDARIHFGIIAQDLQAAFAAEGLDAGDYAMFIHTTWWESTEVIPAVAEELDDKGNVVTEAQPERTVTHHHETQEEAPEGAVQRDRMGVRYPELLAFIIAAM